MPVKRQMKRTVGIVAALHLMATAAAAQTCTATITNLDFGSIDLTSGTVFDTQGTATVTCTGTPGRRVRACFNIAAGTGGVAVGGDPRYLVNGANQLQFNLFKNNARTKVWGSWIWAYPPTGRGRRFTLDSSGNGSASRTVFARIYAGQTTLPDGVYTSTFAGADSLVKYAYASVGNCNAISNSPATPSTTAPFTVTATAVSSCTVTATTLDFGATGVLAGNVDATNAVSVLCPAGTPYTVALDGGLSGAADPTQRKMVKGSEQITYGIYRDAARTLPWGSTVGVDTQAGTGTGAVQTYTGYGRVPAQVTPSPGAYTDTIVVTVNF